MNAIITLHLQRPIVVDKESQGYHALDQNEWRCSRIVGGLNIPLGMSTFRNSFDDGFGDRRNDHGCRLEATGRGGCREHIALIKAEGMVVHKWNLPRMIRQTV